jgi:hypothetical protein
MKQRTSPNESFNESNELKAQLGLYRFLKSHD